MGRSDLIEAEAKALFKDCLRVTTDCRVELRQKYLIYKLIYTLFHSDWNIKSGNMLVFVYLTSSRIYYLFLATIYNRYYVLLHTHVFSIRHHLLP